MVKRFSACTQQSPGPIVGGIIPLFVAPPPKPNYIIDDTGLMKIHRNTFSHQFFPQNFTFLILLPSPPHTSHLRSTSAPVWSGLPRSSGDLVRHSWHTTNIKVRAGRRCDRTRCGGEGGRVAGRKEGKSSTHTFTFLHLRNAMPFVCVSFNKLLMLLIYSYYFIMRERCGTSHHHLYVYV